MKKTTSTIMLFVMTFSSVSLSARDHLLENKSKVDKLTWELTDSAMKKTATSQVMWGILLPVGIAVLSMTIKSNPSAETSSTSTTSSSS